jgi:hypothetical protein
MLPTILVSRLTPYIDKIIGDIIVNFDISTTDQLHEKKWGYNGTVHQLFVHFEERNIAQYPH